MHPARRPHLHLPRACTAAMAPSHLSPALLRRLPPTFSPFSHRGTSGWLPYSPANASSQRRADRCNHVEDILPVNAAGAARSFRQMICQSVISSEILERLGPAYSNDEWRVPAREDHASGEAVIFARGENKPLSVSFSLSSSSLFSRRRIPVAKNFIYHRPASVKKEEYINEEIVNGALLRKLKISFPITELRLQ